MVVHEDTIDHCSFTHNLRSYEINDYENSGLNGIWTHDLCDTGDFYCVELEMCVKDIIF